MDQESPPQDQPSITLSDLVVLLNLVRIASDRGAIKAEELSVVGATYDRLLKFLDASGVINKQEPTPTDNTPPDQNS